MDIRQLRTFVAVARFASVTKVAEVLHFTQPAVSGQLKSLEDELQVRLLSRTTSSVTLTQCGRELLGKAEKAIEALSARLQTEISHDRHDINENETNLNE